MVGLWYNTPSGATELLITRCFIMVGFVLSQLKPSELYILRFEKGSAVFKAKNVEFLELYPIHIF